MRSIYALIMALGCCGLVIADQPRHPVVNRPNHAPAPVRPVVNKPRPNNVRPLTQGVKRVHNPNYHKTFGKRFKNGWYYSGWRHNHWSRHFWDNRYGCYLYLDPNVNTYFYWCAPHYRFYPVSYVPVGLGYVYPYDPNPQPPAVEPPPPPE